MKVNKAFLGSILIMWSSFASATPWVIDDGHSKALFTVKHLMVTNVTGKITGIKGLVDIDEKDITKSKLDVTLDAATINTDNEKRDEHLKSPDFLDAKKYPTIKFVSTKIQKGKAGHLNVTGDLTIRDKTKSVVLDVEGPSASIKDPWGNVKRGASATTKISRKDFDVSWNKSLDGGGVVVGDEVKITLEIELNEPKPEVKK